MEKKCRIAFVLLKDPHPLAFLTSFHHVYFILHKETIARYGARLWARFIEQEPLYTGVVRLDKVDGLFWECAQSGFRHFIVNPRKNRRCLVPSITCHRSRMAFMAHRYIYHWRETFKRPHIQVFQPFAENS